MDEAVAAGLRAMAEHDLAVRAELAASGELFDGYHPRMRAVHAANAARLSAMLDAHGWPTASRVGAEAAEAAWLVAQHAIGEPAFQRRCLEHVRAAVAASEAPAAQAAFLEDRVRVLEGRPQLYGTQFDWNAEGELSPAPIADPAGVDARRAAVGLESLAERTALLRSRAAAEGDAPPADPAARRAAYEAWLRETGWRGARPPAAT